MSARKLERALEALSFGFAVIPVHSIKARACTCGSPQCDSPGKHPIAELVRNGVKQASRDREQILAWWMEHEDANIGIATGAASNLYVLDVDPRHRGDESLAKLEAEHGPLPKEWISDTGGGGEHRLFSGSDATCLRGRSGFMEGLDWKAKGGYIVGPGSSHLSGRIYEWRTPHAGPRPAAPAWLWTLLRNGSAASMVENSSSESAPILEGQRNARLASAAGTMRKRGMSQEAIEAALLADNRARCVPPLPDHEVQTIARSIGHYAPGPSQSEPRPVEYLTVATQSQEPPQVPRRKRMAGFLIDPEAVLRDPAVQGMNTQEWAAFSRLMLELWRQPDPGVAPDSDAALARLAGMGREEWTVVRRAAQRAFDTTKRPGFWILPWMAETIARQDMYVEDKRAAGKKGARVKAEMARKRRSRVGVKQGSSAAQTIVNQSIRVSGDLGIRSGETSDGDSEGNGNCAPRGPRDDERGSVQTGNGEGKELAVAPSSACPNCGGRVLSWSFGTVCTSCHDHLPADDAQANGASEGNETESESSRRR